VTCNQPTIPNITSALGLTFSSMPLTVLFAHGQTKTRTAFANIARTTGWTVYESATLESTLEILENRAIRVLVCGELLDNTDWRNVQRELELKSAAPSLIVCAEKPDVMLWADVYHRGGYTVLPLPLVRDEVLRTCWLASMSWQSAIETAPRPTAIATCCGRRSKVRPVITASAAA
jgi:DNA-binding NtrC family response regulator